MCGRFSLTATGLEVVEAFDLAVEPPLAPRYNIAPAQPVVIIRTMPEGADREATLALWGLIPSWTKDPRVGAKLANARAETLAEKASFRNAYRRRRCLVPATGFYEWKTVGGARQPYLVEVDGGRLFAMAGLWEMWHGPEGEQIESCTVVTCRPNELMATIHTRMPVIVAREAHARYLSRAEAKPGEMDDLFAPFPSDRMSLRPVSRRVNSVRFDDADCQKPPDDPAPPKAPADAPDLFGGEAGG